MKNILFYILPLAVLTMFVNCSPRVVPVRQVQIDSVYISRVEHDTIRERDSIYISAVADTVFKTVYKWRYRDRVVRDTVWRMQRDTIPRVVTVEKELSRMERIKLSLGEVFLWIIIAGAVAVALWFAKRLKGL